MRKGSGVFFVLETLAMRVSLLSFKSQMMIDLWRSRFDLVAASGATALLLPSVSNLQYSRPCPVCVRSVRRGHSPLAFSKYVSSSPLHLFETTNTNSGRAATRYMLGMLSSVLQEVENAFDGYQFYKASQVTLTLLTHGDANISPLHIAFFSVSRGESRAIDVAQEASVSCHDT